MGIIIGIVFWDVDSPEKYESREKYYQTFKYPKNHEDFRLIVRLTGSYREGD